MRTIGKRWHHGMCGVGRCDICGANYPMSELRKNGDGHWCCADDIGGLTKTELAEYETESAMGVSAADLAREMATFDGGEEL